MTISDRAPSTDILGHLSTERLQGLLDDLLADLAEAQRWQAHPQATGDRGVTSAAMAMPAVIKFLEAIPGVQQLGLAEPLHAHRRTRPMRPQSLTHHNRYFNYRRAQQQRG